MIDTKTKISVHPWLQVVIMLSPIILILVFELFSFDFVDKLMFGGRVNLYTHLFILSAIFVFGWQYYSSLNFLKVTNTKSIFLTINGVLPVIFFSILLLYGLYVNFKNGLPTEEMLNKFSNDYNLHAHVESLRKTNLYKFTQVVFFHAIASYIICLNFVSVKVKLISSENERVLMNKFYVKPFKYLLILIGVLFIMLLFKDLFVFFLPACQLF